MTNYRGSTDYGIDDGKGDTPMQPHDSNINIGGSSLLGFALGLRPSKDMFWTHRLVLLQYSCSSATALVLLL